MDEMIAHLFAGLKDNLKTAATAACEANGELKGQRFDVGINGAENVDGDQYTKVAMDDIVRASQDYSDIQLHVDTDVWLWIDGKVELGDEVNVHISCSNKDNLTDYLVDLALQDLDKQDSELDFIGAAADGTLDVELHGRQKRARRAI